MTWRYFCTRIAGLSPDSLWRRVVAATPVELSSEQAQQTIGNL